MVEYASSKPKESGTATAANDGDDSSRTGEEIPKKDIVASAATATHKEGGDNTKSPKDPAKSGKPRRRIVRRRRGGRGRDSRSNPNAVPESILKNKLLNEHVRTTLPPDYDFEVHKTVHRILSSNSRHVALQMPEGLLMYGCVLADIFQRFASPSSSSSPSSAAETKEEGKEEREQQQLRVSILGDVTYGACCVDDLSARELGADLLVHYGHSCLVPVTHTAIQCMYVFVEIVIDVQHLVDCVCQTLPVGTNVEVMGTVQFRSAVAEAARLLTERDRPAHVPQAKPLSPGEVLGCTAPTIPAPSPSPSSSAEANQRPPPAKPVMLFLADGRFHLEAAMIANPTLRALRYDPYGKTLTDERYETEKMKRIRRSAITAARDPSVRTFGIVLGTLGRQGNPAVLGRVRRTIRSSGRRCFVVLLSEVLPGKLDCMPQADAWVQVACPRLSVDWGHFFSTPVLSPYELEVCLGGAEWPDGEGGKEGYPMDFYKLGGGEWSNYHEENRGRKMVAR